MKCPRCWADKAYLHEYRGWREMLLGCLAFRAMKCNHCYHHFLIHWVFTIGEQVVPPVLRVTRQRGEGVESGRRDSVRSRNRAAYTAAWVFRVCLVIRSFDSTFCPSIHTGIVVARVLPFVDIHCHMLPGLDDGAVNLGVSLAMAQMAVADGIRTVVVTPHQLGSYSRNRGETIRAFAARFQRELAHRNIPLRVLPGADVRIEPDMIRGVQTGDVVSLADLRRHVLLELPHELYVPLEGLLASLQSAGLVGVLSHPERNQGILREPQVVEKLVANGCLMQVTAGSLVGSFGPQIQEFSEWLVEEGFVHFLATDAHGTSNRRPLMSRAYFRAADLAGERQARLLCCENPAAVVAGGTVASGRQGSLVRAGGWFGRRRAC